MGERTVCFADNLQPVLFSLSFAHFLPFKHIRFVRPGSIEEISWTINFEVDFNTYFVLFDPVIRRSAELGLTGMVLPHYARVPQQFSTSLSAFIYPSPIYPHSDVRYGQTIDVNNVFRRRQAPLAVCPKPRLPSRRTPPSVLTSLLPGLDGPVHRQVCGRNMFRPPRRR